jgi:hypothetical protein
MVREGVVATALHCVQSTLEQVSTAHAELRVTALELMHALSKLDASRSLLFVPEVGLFLWLKEDRIADVFVALYLVVCSANSPLLAVSHSWVPASQSVFSPALVQCLTAICDSMRHDKTSTVHGIACNALVQLVDHATPDQVRDFVWMRWMYSSSLFFFCLFFCSLFACLRLCLFISRGLGCAIVHDLRLVLHPCMSTYANLT